MPVAVHHVRVDLAVAVAVRDHLAAGGEADEGAVVPPVVVLQRLAVAAAVDAVDAAHEAVARHVRGRRRTRSGSRAGSRASGCRATTACRCACRRCRLRCGRAGSASVGTKPRMLRARRVGEVAAHRCRSSWRGRSGAAATSSSGAAAPIRRRSRPAPRSCARTVFSRPRRGVDVRDAGGLPLASVITSRAMAPGDDLQLAGLQGGRQQHRRGREVGVGRAAAAALAAVVAGRAAVERLA